MRNPPPVSHLAPNRLVGLNNSQFTSNHTGQAACGTNDETKADIESDVDVPLSSQTTEKRTTSARTLQQDLQTDPLRHRQSSRLVAKDSPLSFTVLPTFRDRR
ncbi:uncharacterized protein SPSK_05719 [Sporothrix schenckii 1099-18]|uniref:Uncharacterized protein n=1 Tax=Sporothrix schenckii 1099-18 TaxID=1397361 RepID=A0A0F2LSK2_SPOSC|nr:uncharacterized protein SPSK_05719 [Sporothrix schenckii 1099-18]KJR80463.1 hypothetical protein SPSK_05719 [Sporothrix schenckii 1099-18]